MGDQPPHTVKDLLVELKDASELMVDLAYAAVFFNDDKIADEVIRLDGRSGELLRRLRTMAMLAARSPEDAEGMAGAVWIPDAIQRVCDPASRAASGSGPPPATSRAWSPHVWASRARCARPSATPTR